MKIILNLLVVLLALYGAWALYDDFAPADWPRAAGVRLAPLAPAAGEPAAKAAAATNAPAATRKDKETKNVVCPTCEGEGKLTYADSRGANHTYPCPICNGQGGRTLRVRAGQHVCPDCGGMGVTERRETRKGFGGQKDFNREVAGSRRSVPESDAYYVRSSRCLRCNTTGVIKSAKKPKPTVGVQAPEPAR